MNPFATAIAEQVDLSFLNARVAHAPLTTEDTLPLSPDSPFEAMASLVGD
jgi:hypothetical protein